MISLNNTIYGENVYCTTCGKSLNPFWCICGEKESKKKNMNITKESENMKVSTKLDNKELKNKLKEYGNFDSKHKFLYLYDNIHLKDKKLLEICKNNQVYIQLDLLTGFDDV